MNITRRNVLKTGLASALALSYPGYVWAQRGSGVMNVSLYTEPAHLNYPLTNFRAMQLICGSIHEALLIFDWDLKPHPGLAKGVEISPDGLTYTFPLQQGVTWHDGTPFTAKDVVFSFNVMLRELNTRTRAAVERCESITATDDHTVVFKLAKPFSAFLLALMGSGGPIMAAHIYEGTDFRTNPANEKPVGTGPFKLKEWSRGNYITLARNENYWRAEQPKLDEVNFRLIASAQQRAIALETGQVDVATAEDLDPIEVPRFRADPRFTYFDNAYEVVGETAFIKLNLRKKPFDDARFRQAMMHAIDRQFLIEAINFGLARPAHGPIFSTTPYYDDAATTKYEFSPDKAKALLDEMGLKPDANGVRTSMTMVMIPIADGPFIRGAEYVKQALSEVGVAVELQAADSGIYMKRDGDWDYDSFWATGGMFGHPAIGVSRFYMSNNTRPGVPQSNTQGYVNPRVDELFDQAAEAVDPAVANAAYSEIQKILTSEAVMVWLYERTPPFFTVAQLKDVITGPNGPVDGFGQAHREA